MNTSVNWRPSASFAVLRQRSQLLDQIRQFFISRDVLEVDTPLIAPAGNPAPYIEQLTTSLNNSTYYLQTSPEFAMKRLLAAGSGPIFQLNKVFRAGEVGRYHQPEFTMLEWYQPGYNQQQMLDEIHQVCQLAIDSTTYRVYSYAQLFQDCCNLHPLESSIDTLQQYAYEHHYADRDLQLDHDGWLQLIMSQAIEPFLGQTEPCFVVDYPASQAALARLNPDDSRWAQRFELYYQGLELANGFVELTDPGIQRQRFENELAQREQQGLPIMPLDEAFLASLQHGLPDSVGVALGFDRLLMLATGVQHINQVVPFPTY